MNGRLKYKASATTKGQKRAVEFRESYVELDYAPIKDYKMAAGG